MDHDLEFPRQRHQLALVGHVLGHLDRDGGSERCELVEGMFE